MMMILHAPRRSTGGRSAANIGDQTLNVTYFRAWLINSDALLIAVSQYVGLHALYKNITARKSEYLTRFSTGPIRRRRHKIYCSLIIYPAMEAPVDFGSESNCVHCNSKT